MRRRAYLSVLGTAIAAGCTGQTVSSDTTGTTATARRESTMSSTTAEPTTESTTEATTRATTTPELTVASTEQFGLLEVSGGQWMAKEYLRYYDSESESLERLEAENGWWYEFTATFKNLGGEPLEPPSVDSVGLRADGEEFPALESPRGISWDDVRLRDEWKAYWIDPAMMAPSEELQAGASDVVYFLFDANGDTSPYLKVTYDGETVYFTGDRVHSP